MTKRFDPEESVWVEPSPYYLGSSSGQATFVQNLEPEKPSTNQLCEVIIGGETKFVSLERIHKLGKVMQ